MTKRKKIFKKAINFIEETIRLHEEKRKLAEELGQEELERYYTKEILSLKKRKENREEKLNRK